MAIDFNQLNPITDSIIGAAIKVHRALGPGLLESAYHKCLLFELHRATLDVVSKQKLPILYSPFESIVATRSICWSTDWSSAR